MTEWKYLTDVAEEENAPEWVKALARATKPIEGAVLHDDKDKKNKKAALYVIDLTRRALDEAALEILKTMQESPARQQCRVGKE